MPTLAYVLIMSDVTRFQRGKQIASYLGLIEKWGPVPGFQETSRKGVASRRLGKLLGLPGLRANSTGDLHHSVFDFFYCLVCLFADPAVRVSQ